MPQVLFYPLQPSQSQSLLPQKATTLADYLLILGYRLKDNVPEPMLKMRCARAAEYLSKNKSTVAIACGGKTGKTQTVSEAEVVKQLLVSNGIEENRIILEDKSTTTAENFINAMRIIGDCNEKRVALLSSDHHLLRANTLARLCGLKASTVAAPTPSELRIISYVREFFVFPFIFSNIKGGMKK